MTQRLSGTTGLVALLGTPVSHSKSPALQNAAFAALGLDYAYLAFDVGLDRVGEAVQALRVLGARGANVTMPLKKAVCAHLDALSPVARMAGAVNTIVNEGGILTGHITDGEGYLLSLTEADVDYRGRAFTIAGAGGAATAIAIQAAKDGVRAISLFNTRDAFYADGEATCALLRERFDCDARMFDLADAAALKAQMHASDIFINGTPVGMHETQAQSIVPDASFFHPDLVVTDLIYVPAETTLLHSARAAGCRTVGGGGMQLWQGARSFELWTGQPMPVERVRGVLA